MTVMKRRALKVSRKQKSWSQLMKRAKRQKIMTPFLMKANMLYLGLQLKVG